MRDKPLWLLWFLRGAAACPPAAAVHRQVPLATPQACRLARRYAPDRRQRDRRTETRLAREPVSVVRVAVTITVTVVTEPPPPPPPVNAAPLAVDDAAETAEDTPVTIAVLANDRDADGDTLTVMEVSAPAHGTARLTDAGTVEYTPEPDFHGSDRFTYAVGDGSGLTAQAAVAVAGRRASPRADRTRAGGPGDRRRRHQRAP